MNLKHFAALGLALALAGGVMAAGNSSAVRADSAFPLEVGATARSIKLEWDPIDGATGYEVWRKDSVTGEFKLLGGVADLDHPLYFDAPLEAGHYYYYKVVVHLKGGDDLESEADHETDLVAINEENFPDPEWRGYVLDELDTDRSEGLSRYEISNAEYIACDGFAIKDFKGIEYLTEMEYFSVMGNSEITSVDLSGNNKLTSVMFWDCGLESMDNIVLNPNITTLNLHYNKLAALDLTAFTKLQKLDVSGNELTSLNITGLTGIKELEVNDNKLGSINVSAFTKLTKLAVGSNPIKALNVSTLTGLKELSCSFCQLTSLDVSKNTELKILYCQTNLLTSLDVSNNEKIVSLDCSENKIEDLDLCATASYLSLDVHQNNIPYDEIPAFATEKYPQRYMTPKYIENLEVTGTTDSSISLEWEVIDNAAGYQVWKADSVYSTAALKATVTGKDKTTYKDTSVTKGSSYYYYIIPYSEVELEGTVTTYTSEDFLFYSYDDSGYHTFHNGVSAKAETTEFKINIADTVNGTVSTDVTSAKAGTLVTVMTTPDAGYKCTGRAVTTKSGEDVFVADNDVFVMPAEEVTVSATFEKESYYLMAVYDGRLIEVTGLDGIDEAYYGDRYEFTVKIKDEFADEFEIIYVTANDVTLLPDSNGKYHATQPAGNLTIAIVADFKDEGPIAADGWFVQDDGTKIYIEGGEPVKGWKTIDGKKYYFNKNTGVMATGWKKFSNGKVYYFAKSTGAAVKQCH